MENYYERKYKWYLERAKEAKSSTSDKGFLKWLDETFPEIKEHEDEKIRNALLKHFSQMPEHGYLTGSDVTFNDVISWLEKKGEQKPTDEVKPKFKVDDWITNGEYNWKVTDIKPLDYILQSPNGDVVDDTISYVDEHLHLWTIQDAKDGDVLNSVRVNATIIFKGFADDGKHIRAYCALQNGIFIQQETLWDRDFEPASEYWKNTLYDAMTAKGYEWDAENKGLKKIEQKSAEWSIDDAKCGDVLAYPDGTLAVFNYRLDGLDAGLYMSYLVCSSSEIKYKQTCAIHNATKATKEQIEILFNNLGKSAKWSEKDKRQVIINAYNYLVNYSNSLINGGNSAKADAILEIANELKSINPQQKQEWNEEDEVRFKNLCSIIDDDSKWNKVSKDGFKNWLKSLKNEVQPQLEQEWGEEDEKMISKIDCYLCSSIGLPSDEKDSIMNWLKSLKPGKKELVKWDKKDRVYYEDIRDILKGLLTNNEYTKTAVENDLKWLSERFDLIEPHPVQEWNERDILMLNNCIAKLEESRDSRSGWPNNMQEINWLKSLMDKSKNAKL